MTADDQQPHAAATAPGQISPQTADELISWARDETDWATDAPARPGPAHHAGGGRHEAAQAPVAELAADLAPELERAAEQAAPEAGDEPLPSFSEQLADQLGGVRGLIESGVPVLVFVVVNLVWALRPAIVVAAASAVVIAVFRLAKKQTVRHAINGLFGIGLGAVIAWKTGSAKNFYLPGILLSLAYGLAMLASVALRVPLLADKGSTAWRTDRRMVRTFSWLTVVWALTYLAKTGVQAVIFQHTSDSDPGTALGIARLALGYPPYLLLIAITVWVVKRNHPHGAVATVPAGD
jgi:hypothetical protein